MIDKVLEKPSSHSLLCLPAHMWFLLAGHASTHPYLAQYLAQS